MTLVLKRGYFNFFSDTQAEFFNLSHLLIGQGHILDVRMNIAMLFA